MPSYYLLWLAIFFAWVFLGLRWQPYFAARPFVKSAMAIFLALFCLSTPEAILAIMSIGFALSAIGDFFLDLRNDKYFIHGLIAFFLAHVAFVVYLFAHMPPFVSFTSFEWSLVIGLPVIAIGFYLWIYSSLPKDMKIPVAAYSTIITLMGIAALTSQLPSLLLPVGAVLFIASDAILAVERFKFKIPMGDKLNWLFYASGQILLAVGVLSAVGA